MTGASGYVGSMVAQKALARGYEVYGLSRTEASDAKLSAQGIVPVRGDLTSVDVLREQSASADIVLHLADAFAGFQNSYDEVLRIDASAISAFAAGMEGSNKPLVATSGTLVVAATGAETTEESPLNEKPLNDRIKSEQNSLKLSEKGIKVSALRLAPFVYGRGGSGVRLFMQMFAQSGEAVYIDDGAAVTSAVHVDEAAELYLLAAEKAETGEVFNAVSSTVTYRQLTEAMGEIMGLPVRSMPSSEAAGQLGEFVTGFLSTENNASAAKAKKVLGWAPTAAGILEDVRQGSYVAVAAALQASRAA
ncbi:putative NAD dependent epimerase/dehydratase [Aspergillus steynii IBT 23096]|uniref:Putative NAD dependent epimerase/dehydratase n=1 Tax=Aspergillus steynii IBT 23096 TaxID=1392250 RepID=A0A2I2G544_9EURO|nr:putative NAD dependent epimerase/dehydratase [Aspergillus steynii IBT 23096]PLB47997.1 putative NAD dependent epimerase/dehydratase [Aspergillus steynii IBT 23096]